MGVETERMSGIVKRFNPKTGYGFIGCPDGPDRFVHAKDVEGRRDLVPGERVSFMPVDMPKGPAAIVVKGEAEDDAERRTPWWG